MSWPFLARVALGLAIIASDAQPAGSQQLDALSIGFRRPAVPVITSAPAAVPSNFQLGRASVGSALSFAVLAGGVGSLVDAAYCEQHHGDEPSILFGPCFLYTGIGTAAGWFGGAFLGATVRAARVARKRGCPSRGAVVRAMAGAALGVAPGLSIVARRPGKYPPAHTALVVGAPVLAGLGAAAAVVGCRAP